MSSMLALVLIILFAALVVVGCVTAGIIILIKSLDKKGDK